MPIPLVLPGEPKRDVDHDREHDRPDNHRLPRHQHTDGPALIVTFVRVRFREIAESLRTRLFASGNKRTATFNNTVSRADRTSDTASHCMLEGSRGRCHSGQRARKVPFPPLRNRQILRRLPR